MRADPTSGDRLDLGIKLPVLAAVVGALALLLACLAIVDRERGRSQLAALEAAFCGVTVPPEALAGGDREGDAVEGNDATEANGDAAHIQQRVAGTGLCLRRKMRLSVGRSCCDARGRLTGRRAHELRASAAVSTTRVGTRRLRQLVFPPRVRLQRHAIIVAHPPRKNSLPLVGQMSDRHQPRRQETSRLIPNMKQFLPEMRAWRSPIPWIIARAASHFAR